MFEKFINAYKMAYFKIFGDDLYGRFKRFENELTEPKFHASTELKDELRKLDLFINEPVTIAIVGQFSSGKSTFLNVLLGREILPTGVTPVTAKLTHIRYGQSYALRVDYKNGKELNLDVSEIAKFVDQRVFGDDVKQLCIYAPVPLLKSVNFIDTPGLNSLSNSDTNITKEVLKDVAGVIWLSLIENAARASELNDLNEFLANSDKLAICVLNQKDKLSQSELENVLDHARTTYRNFFAQIIAISAKQAIEAQKQNDRKLAEISNFAAVTSAIERHFSNENLKQNFVLKKCAAIVRANIDQHEYIERIYKDAGEILQNFDDTLGESLKALALEFRPKIELAFNELKQIAKQIADEIQASLKPFKKSRFELKKGLLKGEYYEKSEYEMMSFDNDEIFSKLIYNDTKLAKFFRIYRRDLGALQSELCAKVDEIYARLEREFMIYKARFESIRKEEAVHSDIEFAAIRTYAGQVYEMFLRDYETAKFKQLQKISLFFDKLNLKVAANYENAIKIAVHFIKEKIDNAALSYEKDPLHFSLFIPGANEIYERVLTSLNLYEFENEMLGNASFLNKILNALAEEFHELKGAKMEKISRLAARHEALKNELLQIGKEFGSGL
ncbi:dynamin family protein [Campylobacter curvus]|uniref:dynamin family protein n=1 Tax=Campylobacter curvus TaxID=200 RepID=UPI00146FD799|nr:dynamin family protein [Campylobacter curvus]